MLYKSCNKESFISAKASKISVALSRGTISKQSHWVSILRASLHLAIRNFYWKSFTSQSFSKYSVFFLDLSVLSSFSLSELGD